MVMKKQAAKAAPKNDDSVVYKVMVALLIACLECLGLQQVAKVYTSIEHMDTVRSVLPIVGAVFAVLTVAAAVCMVVFRSRSALRFTLGLAAANLLLLTVGAFALYGMWTGPVMLLYFAFFALAVLVSVQLLYQPEFFLLTAATMVAAFGFYCLSKLYGSGSVALIVLVNLAMALCFVLLLVVSYMAAHNKGILSFGKVRFRVLALSSALPLYVTGLLWLLCQLAGLILGAVFCYCCIFAAIALELVSAFYFTIKLK
ncbi:MAG: hypothetical protein E7449_02490 [Ruminococcaceae bacterium]|nr:hypothetical protein [Oscillospiraceae bacterium]